MITAHNLRLPHSRCIALCFLRHDSPSGGRTIAVMEHPPPPPLTCSTFPRVLSLWLSLWHGPSFGELGEAGMRCVRDGGPQAERSSASMNTALRTPSRGYSERFWGAAASFLAGLRGLSKARFAAHPVSRARWRSALPTQHWGTPRCVCSHG